MNREDYRFNRTFIVAKTYIERRSWSVHSVAISFPNQSRSYDAIRKVVLFWGYDGVMEKAFSIPVDALMKIRMLLKHDEAGLLQIFDANRDLIYQAASKAYSRKSNGPFNLTAANF
jgi:hypothetical protein